MRLRWITKVFLNTKFLKITVLKNTKCLELIVFKHKALYPLGTSENGKQKYIVFSACQLESLP